MIIKVKARENITIPAIHINGKLRSPGITIPKNTIGETELMWSLKEEDKEITFYVNDIKAVVNIPIQVAKEKIEIYMDDINHEDI